MFLFILHSRYECQLSLFLELNFNCHAPTVLGKNSVSIGHLHDGVIYYFDQNTFRFFFHI